MSDKPLKIMVVDDDPIVLEAIAATLEDEGYWVVTRDQALGTSAAILQHRPDYILLDVNMPGLTGDALAKLLSAHPDMPMSKIIFHSADDAAKLGELVRGLGALGAIEKTDPKSFLVAFRGLIGSRSAST